MRDANGNVTHYVINDTGTGTSGRMVPADQFHQSLDGYDAVMTDAPIRTPTAARETGLPADDAPTGGEAPGAPRDAASRGDPASEEGDPTSGERVPNEAEEPGEAGKPGDTPEARTKEEEVKAAGSGDPTVPIGDRPGGLRNGEGEDGPSTYEEDPASTRGTGPRRVFDDATMDRWARDYADKVGSDRPWTWARSMDPNIPESVQGAIRDRAVSKGWIADIPVDKSTAPRGFADFTGQILHEVQLPHYITDRNGNSIDLWKAKDDVQFRWANK